MIDPKTEKLIRLADVPALNWLPSGPRGSPFSVATIYSWARRGIKNIRLETVQAGGVMSTSEAAIVRFFELLTARAPEQTTPRPDPKAHARAEAILDGAGI